MQLCMESKMSDYFLMIAGVSGMGIAIAHGVIGHRLILKHITGLSPVLRDVNYAVFQISTVYWFAGGLALLLAPRLLDPSGQMVVVVAVVFLYLVGAARNAWAMRGRHFGAYALLGTAILASLGV